MAASLSSTVFKAEARGNPCEYFKIKSPYQPHLDGLRALAIIGVLIEHMGLIMPSMLRYGPLGVRFFFVLSGYFITLSLWRMKSEMAQYAGSLGSYLGRFYLNRLLRIGPPFYLALIVGVIFGIEGTRSAFFWLATFQANQYILHLGYWPNGISHFWSLAVQEQFYLLWPLVVLTLPRRWFIPAMAALILFGFSFRIFCMLTHASTMMRWVTLFGCSDSFATGALVAYLVQFRLLEKMRFLSHTLLFAMPLFAFSCFFMGRALMTLPEGNLWLGCTETVDAVFLAWLLLTALAGVKNRYNQLLSWKPLVYLGRISYGIYIYHVFVIILVSPLLLSYGLSENHYALIRCAILSPLTLAVASLSWHFMEKPLLIWKNTLTTRRGSSAVGQMQASSA